MTAGGLPIAVAASGSGLSSGQLIVLLIGIVLLFFLGVRLWQYVRERTAKPRIAQGRIVADSLLAIWRTFLDRQPPAARTLVSRYPWVVLMGESGAGKTALVDAKADVSGVGVQHPAKPVESLPLREVLIDYHSG